MKSVQELEKLEKRVSWSDGLLPESSWSTSLGTLKSCTFTGTDLLDVCAKVTKCGSC